MTSIETRPLLRSARVLEVSLALILTALMAAAAVVLGWLFVNPTQLGQVLAGLAGHGAGPEGAGMRMWQSLALAALVLIQISLWGGVTWQGRRIFAALLADDLPQAIGAARLTALLLWGVLAWGIIVPALGSVVATYHFPPGTRAVSVVLGSAQVSTLVAALLATFTAQALTLGAALWQDHRDVI